MLNFWGPKKYKKVINSSTKCLISVKIAIMTPHIIPLPLVNVWLIFDLQKYVNWPCVFSKVNPFFQKAQVFCMDLQPAADPYNVVCRMALFRVVWEYTALVMMIFTSPYRLGEWAEYHMIIMTRAVYSHTTLNAILYYINIWQQYDNVVNKLHHAQLNTTTTMTFHWHCRDYYYYY